MELAEKHGAKWNFLYDPALSIRVGQYVQNLRFFNVFKIRQAHLLPKVSKQANFRGSLPKLPAVPLKKCKAFELLHLQNSYFYFVAKVPKMPKDIKIKNEGHI